MNMVRPHASLVVGFAFVTLCASPIAQSQPPAAPKPSFEVASVKPNKSAGRAMSLADQPGGRFTASNVTLAMLVGNAFGVHESQVIGLPEWSSSERFDIVAKAEREFPRTNEKPRLAQLMVQSLLEDRFKLVAHHETRDLPGYALVVVRADGRLGPQLKPSGVDCAAALAAARRAGGAPPAPSPGERRPCTMSMSGGGGKLRAGSVTMASLTTTLSTVVQRIVVDRTGLTGGFDFDLTFSTEQSGDATNPSVFTAIQEQLGLKLESMRLPTDVLVIDNIERPTPD